MVSLTAKDDGSIPTNFEFAAAKIEDAKTVYQRYADADLVTASALLDLVSKDWLGALAAAGLMRLGMTDRITDPMPRPTRTPATMRRSPRPAADPRCGFRR